MPKKFSTRHSQRITKRRMREDLQITNRLLYQLSYVGTIYNQQLTDSCFSVSRVIDASSFRMPLRTPRLVAWM
jgi:hypothetical protein